MTVKFPSEAWIKELEVKLNASESYAHAAATWEGDQIFVILPDEDFKDTAYFYIDTGRVVIKSQGEVRGAMRPAMTLLVGRRIGPSPSTLPSGLAAEWEASICKPSGSTGPPLLQPACWARRLRQ